MFIMLNKVREAFLVAVSIIQKYSARLHRHDALKKILETQPSACSSHVKASAPHEKLSSPSCLR